MSIATQSMVPPGTRSPKPVTCESNVKERGILPIVSALRQVRTAVEVRLRWKKKPGDSDVGVQ